MDTLRTIMNILSGPDDDSDYEKSCAGLPINSSLILRPAPTVRPRRLMQEPRWILSGIPVDEKRRCGNRPSCVLVIGDWSPQQIASLRRPSLCIYARHTARFWLCGYLLLPFAVLDRFLKADASGLPTSSSRLLSYHCFVWNWRARFG
jgi:hypothetical protein